MVIEAPPPLEQDRRLPMLMTVGPALTMTLPMMAGSAVAVLGSTTGGELYVHRHHHIGSFKPASVPLGRW